MTANGRFAPDAAARRRFFDELMERLSALPGVRQVSAIPDLYARVNRAFHEGDDAFARLPDGPEAAADLVQALRKPVADIPIYGGLGDIKFPLIADLNKSIARSYDGGNRD